MIDHLLKDTVTVYTVTESVSTTTGENVKTNSTGDVIAARISPLSQREIYYANKNNLDTTHRMYCDYTSSILAGDRVVVGASTFEVMGITNPSMWDKFLQVDLKRVS